MRADPHQRSLRGSKLSLVTVDLVRIGILTNYMHKYSNSPNVWQRKTGVCVREREFHINLQQKYVPRFIVLLQYSAKTGSLAICLICAS